MLSSFDQAAVALYPGLRRLIDLREQGGWQFLPIYRDGELGLIAAVRTWPDGSSAALVVADINDAKAFRCDPAGGEVWSREGGLVDVIEALIELPAPGEPGAPHLVKAKAQRLPAPGMT